MLFICVWCFCWSSSNLALVEFSDNRSACFYDIFISTARFSLCLDKIEHIYVNYQQNCFLLSRQYSYELLLQFLHKTQSTTILGIINEHINFQGISLDCLYYNILFWLATFCHFHNWFAIYDFVVSPGQPSSICDDADVVTVIGGNQDAANQINQKEVHWGVSYKLLSFSFWCLMWSWFKF